MYLTKALKAGVLPAYGALYDEYADALYAYCRVMVGDEADDVLRDVFVAVARDPDAAPDADTGLPAWLHSLVRAECVRRGALRRGIVTTDPPRRALALVSPEHREVLALSNALGPAEIAQVLGVSPDTAETLVREARWHLEQAAASVDPADAAMLAPLTGDALHRLVTLGYVPSAAQRERVLSACVAALHAPGGAAVFGADGRPLPPDAYAAQADDATHQFPAVSAEDPVTEPLSRFGGVSADTRPDLPLPIVGTGGGPPLLPDGHPRAGRSSLGRRLIPVVALVACAAAASGAALAWPRPHHTGQTTAVVHETPRRTAEPTPSHDRPSPAKSPTPHRTTSPSGRADRPATPTREPARSPSPTHRATPHRTPGGGHRTAAPGRTCLGPFGPYRCPRPHSWPPPEVDPYG